MKKFYSGTSGLILPVPKSGYPPEFHDKSRLTYYAAIFNTVEVNSSFYKIPLARTIEKWSDSVPDSFRFTFKLWKGITHVKELAFDPAHVNNFIKALSYANDKKGCLLVQFPPSLTNKNLPELEHLLICIRNSDLSLLWNVAVEYRNRSWYDKATYKVLEKYKTALVLHDIPASATPFNDYHSDVMYLRFHGPAGGYRGSYTDDLISEYAGYIQSWLSENKTVYVYFNNTMGGAFKNLMHLNNLIF